MAQENYKILDGIKCYHPERCGDHEDYPAEGFEVTDELEEKSFWCKTRSRILKFIINKYAQGFQKAKFLEVGCGTGYTLNCLVEQKNLSLTGSEIYLRGLQSAKRRLTGIEFIQLDIVADVPFTQEYNMVGAFDVIEHIEDDVKAMQNVKKILTPGGYFIITVPQYQFLWSRLDEIVKHKRRYSRKELISKLRSQGFEIAYCSSFVFTLFPLMLVSRLFNRRSAKDIDIKTEFENKVKFNPLLNSVFDKIMRIDEWFIQLGVSLPVGGSLLVVAKKPTELK